MLPRVIRRRCKAGSTRGSCGRSPRGRGL